MRRRSFLAALAFVLAPAPHVYTQEKPCGELVTLSTRANSKTSYSLAGTGGSIALVFLPGGAGLLSFAENGCPAKQTTSPVVRWREPLHAAGFVTALADAPTDWRGEDGLAGFRIHPQHAEDIGKVIADVRERVKVPVWLVGHSRGSISAVNAAARLSGPEAPDGLILTSPVTSGREGGQKAWVAQTVFSLPLDAIKIPVLVLAHSADKCIRTPPNLVGNIAPRLKNAKVQTVTVTGGPPYKGGTGVEACEGNAPHGFVAQDAELVAGIIRFIRGGNY